MTTGEDRFMAIGQRDTECVRHTAASAVAAAVAGHLRCGLHPAWPPDPAQPGVLPAAGADSATVEDALSPSRPRGRAEVAEDPTAGTGGLPVVLFEPTTAVGLTAPTQTGHAELQGSRRAGIAAAATVPWPVTDPPGGSGLLSRLLRRRHGPPG